MIGDHPNATLVRQLYAARESSDNDTIRSILHPEVYWSDPYPPPFGGEFNGLDEVFDGLFLASFEQLDESGFEIHDVIANDVHAIALVRWWAVRGRRRFDGKEVGIFHIEDGFITQVWFMTDEKQAAWEFFR